MIPPTAAEIQQASTDELVDLIKELLGTNNGLKKELGETQARLDETRTDLTIAQEKWQALEDQQSPHAHMGLDLMRSNSADSHSGSNRQQIGHSHRPTLDQQVTALASKRPSQTSRVRNHAAAATRGRSKSLNKSKSPMRRAPVPKATTSTPAVHHHYHYYVDHAHDDALNAKLDKSLHSSNPPTRDASIASATRVLLSRATLPPVSIAPVDDESPIRRASLSSPLATHAPFLSEELKMASPSPYASLHEQVHTLMQRLASTDIRSLNRRLQRAFDIVELTQRSNSMLQNIVADIDVLDARFAWLTNDKQQDYRFFTHEFLAMVHLLQDVLKEFGQLNITMNHLQVAYVNKMERLQESQLSAPATPTSAMDTTRTTSSSSSPSTSPLTPLNPVAWFSTFFVDEHAPQTPSSPSQHNKEWAWPSFTTLIDDLRLTNAKTAAASSTSSTLDAKWTPSFSTKWLGSND
ncbi:hypothetical protein BC940DRAFT_48028 [Gongronella butleri]|nr:hypothetical protein BC940DRAFT_48028 [Gongronella butleri]